MRREEKSSRLKEQHEQSPGARGSTSVLRAGRTSGFLDGQRMAREGRTPGDAGRVRSCRVLQPR